MYTLKTSLLLAERHWICWTSYFVMTTEKGCLLRRPWNIHIFVCCKSNKIIILIGFWAIDPVLKEAAINAAGPQPGLQPPGLNQSDNSSTTAGATPGGMY